ncbi:MAG: hypothetical protein HC822_12785 [Oscillochloris sp.]|nr:hypothetical protein [Oscillochloris sp.]
MQFGFQLRLRNPDFTLFTDLSAPTQAAALVYRNSQVSDGNPVGLQLEPRTSRASEGVVLPADAQTTALTLAGRPAAGLQATDFTVQGPGRALDVRSYDAAAKLLVIDTSAARAGDRVLIDYATTPRPAHDIFAEVWIDYGAAIPGVGPDAGLYRIDFQASQLTWAYYVVANSAAGNFAIRDKGKNGAGLKFSAPTSLEQPDPADPIATALAEQYPTLQRMRFVSQQPVTCQQSTRKAIQLLHNDNVLIDPLPNPALRNYTTFAGAPPGACLFQVVTYVTRPNTSSGG